MTTTPQTDADAVTLLLKNYEARLTEIEKQKEKSALERLTKNGSVAALFLGIILSAISLYDVTVEKPRAAHINALSHFNAAVNSAAKVQQDALHVQLQTTDPQLRMVMNSFATPQILNHLSTARAILPNLPDADIEIPQLIILINAAMISNELTSANEFAAQAVKKTNVSPYLQSEAKRYQAKVYFMSGKPAEARVVMQEALAVLGGAPQYAAMRALVLGDWISLEYISGDCTTGLGMLDRFAAEMTQPSVPLESRAQLLSGLKVLAGQFREGKCQIPAGFFAPFGI